MSEARSVVLPVSSVFQGRYQILRCIKAGGMGAVYEVMHLETRRHRALKVMLADMIADPDLRARFKQEATVAADVDSEHIVETLDAGVDEATGTPFIVMELLKGEELADLLGRRGSLSADETVGFLWQAALALDRTHAAGIVHRDLKPENLFVTYRDDGTPKLKVLDFGIAKVVQQDARAARSTRVVGTPIYMAPEQLRGDAGVGPAADLYAVAHIAFTLLVGAPYWEDEAAAGGTYAVIAASMQPAREPPCARAWRRGKVLPQAFDGWFAKATALDPRGRFGTASELCETLADVLAVMRPRDSIRGASWPSSSRPPSSAAPSGAATATVAPRTWPSAQSPSSTSEPGRPMVQSAGPRTELAAPASVPPWHGSPGVASSTSVPLVGIAAPPSTARTGTSRTTLATIVAGVALVAVGGTLAGVRYGAGGDTGVPATAGSSLPDRAPTAPLSATAGGAAARTMGASEPRGAPEDEWDSVREVIVKGSDALGCQTKVLRDRLRVLCRGPNDTGGLPRKIVVTMGNTLETTTASSDGMMNLTMPYRSGTHVEATFSWSDKSHQLIVYWALGTPKPPAAGMFVGSRSVLDEPSPLSSPAGADPTPPVGASTIACVKCATQEDFDAAQRKKTKCCPVTACNSDNDCGARVCCRIPDGQLCADSGRCGRVNRVDPR